jgi:hypothetical protein
LELSKSFLDRLKAHDQTLNAWFDGREDSINVWSERSGIKDLILSEKRQYAENYHELEQRILSKLRDMDVWKRFDNPRQYDDYLDQQEKEYREKKKKEFEEKRMRLFKDNKKRIRHAMENAKSGRLHSGEGMVQDKNYIVRP